MTALSAANTPIAWYISNARMLYEHITNYSTTGNPSQVGVSLLECRWQRHAVQERVVVEQLRADGVGRRRRGQREAQEALAVHLERGKREQETNVGILVRKKLKL